MRWILDANPESLNWRLFIRRHWSAVTIFAVAAILLFVWAVWAFLWFAALAQSSGIVPAALGLWTMGNLLNFILNAIFWGLLLVAIPAAGVAISAWLWWRRLPPGERGDSRIGKRGQSAGGSGGISLLFFIAFLIKVYLDGNWNLPIGKYTLDYVVNSMVLILEWLAVIFGIPLVIGLIWWIGHERARKPVA